MAFTDNAMVTDTELAEQLGEVRVRVNVADVWLELFTDDHEPHPEDEFLDFTLPTLDGYAAVELDGEWAAVARDEAGVWSMQTEIYEFEVDAEEEDSELVYGFFVHIDGDVRYITRFDEPIEWSVMQKIRIRVVWTQYAALVLKALVLS
jgi:hypothetical protein